MIQVTNLYARAVQVTKNIELIRELNNQYKNGILSNEFIDKVIDRLFDMTLVLIDADNDDYTVNFLDRQINIHPILDYIIEDMENYEIKKRLRNNG
jgi:hypothetical protein